MANTTTIRDEFNKLQKNQLFLVIGILFFVALIFWVGVSLLTAQQSTRITPQQQEMAKPLQPTINSSVLDNLATKLFYSENELRAFTIYKILNVRDGRRAVVPIDTPEDAFIEAFEEEAVEETTSESANLLDAITTPDAATPAGTTPADETILEETPPEPEPAQNPPETTEDPAVQN